MATRSTITTPATKLLDKIIADQQLKNDAALARLLEVAPPIISKIRYNKLPITASTMITIHEKTGMSIADIKAALKDAAE